jgi:hypothetical protein
MDVLLFVGMWVVVQGSRNLFASSKINDINEVRGFANANDEVGGFDVAMDKWAGVDEFDAGYLEGVRFGLNEKNESGATTGQGHFGWHVK